MEWVHDEGRIALYPDRFLVHFLGVVVEEPLVILAPGMGCHPAFEVVAEVHFRHRSQVIVVLVGFVLLLSLAVAHAHQ